MIYFGLCIWDDFNNGGDFSTSSSDLA